MSGVTSLPAMRRRAGGRGLSGCRSSAKYITGHQTVGTGGSNGSKRASYGMPYRVRRNGHWPRLIQVAVSMKQDSGLHLVGISTRQTAP